MLFRALPFCLVFILGAGATDPDEPDLNINVFLEGEAGARYHDVNLNVHILDVQPVSGIGNESSKELDKEDCKNEDNVYPNGSIWDGRCVHLKCINGLWNYTGYQNENCKWCSSYHYSAHESYITPYEQPHVIDGSNIWSLKFNGYTEGTYVLSQFGIAMPAVFGVNITYEYNSYYSQSCIASVIYEELGITVELVFPDPYYFSNCADLTDPYEDPLCASKVLVNGKVIRLNSTHGSVTSFYATNGTVFIINNGDQWPYTYKIGEILILGSQGITVQVSYENWYPYDVNSLAMPSLRNKLFGLCNVFTGRSPTSWTDSSGLLTNDTDAFIKSWKNITTRDTTIKTTRKPPTTAAPTTQPITAHKGTCVTMTCGIKAECIDANGTISGMCKCLDHHIHNDTVGALVPEYTDCNATCSALSCGLNTDCYDGNGTEPANCTCMDGYITEGRVNDVPEGVNCSATCSTLTCGLNTHCFDGDNTEPATCACIDNYSFEGRDDDVPEGANCIK